MGKIIIIEGSEGGMSLFAVWLAYMEMKMGRKIISDLKYQITDVKNEKRQQ